MNVLYLLLDEARDYLFGCASGCLSKAVHLSEGVWWKGRYTNLFVGRAAR
jgi:hypothetical protein